MQQVHSLTLHVLILIYIHNIAMQKIIAARHWLTEVSSTASDWGPDCHLKHWQLSVTYDKYYFDASFILSSICYFFNFSLIRLWVFFSFEMFVTANQSTLVWSLQFPSNSFTFNQFWPIVPRITIMLWKSAIIILKLLCVALSEPWGFVLISI